MTITDDISSVLLLGGVVLVCLLTLWMVWRQFNNIVTAFVQIWVNKGRALLTTLGIIIAVTATITIVSMVESFGTYFTDILKGFGTNLVFVLPHRPSGEEGRQLGRVVLEIEDVRAVGARCDRVRRISPVVFSAVSVEYGRVYLDPGEVELRGATEQFQSIRNYGVDCGRFFGPIDVDSGSYVAVLGRDVLRRLQCDESILEDYIYLNGVRFKVVGLLEAKGNVMGESQDQMIIIPYTTAFKMFPEWGRFMAFMVEATTPEDVDECAVQIASVLRTQHDLQPGQPNDFRILRQDQFLRDFESVKLIANSVLATIVGISLIVGGVGVMNVMLVAVAERTREIGLRKSVGGRRRDILLQFLSEAVVLTFVGGAVGILLGYGICGLVNLHPDMVAVRVPLWAVGMGLGFSVIVGVVFGIVPAMKAAIIHPIDALRYE
jgi:putative ABC transport system permease protein